MSRLASGPPECPAAAPRTTKGTGAVEPRLRSRASLRRRSQGGDVGPTSSRASSLGLGAVTSPPLQTGKGGAPSRKRVRPREDGTPACGPPVSPRWSPGLIGLAASDVQNFFRIEPVRLGPANLFVSRQLDFGQAVLQRQQHRLGSPVSERNTLGGGSLAAGERVMQRLACRSNAGRSARTPASSPRSGWLPLGRWLHFRKPADAVRQ
jgi:hypothetical protein